MESSSEESCCASNAECSSRPVVDKEMNEIENKSDEMNMNGNIHCNQEGYPAVAKVKETSFSEGKRLLLTKQFTLMMIPKHSRICVVFSLVMVL